MTITELVSNLGFPIAAFLLVFYQSSVTIKENTKAVKELTIIIRSMKK